MKAVMTARSADGAWGPSLDEVARAVGEPTAVGRQLVLVFGDPHAPDVEAIVAEIAGSFPGATIAGCSTAGQISHDEVSDGHATATVINFDSTDVRSAVEEIDSHNKSFVVGRRLAERLDDQPQPPAAILVFSDGVHVNGSDLVRGFQSGVPSDTVVVGGLAADGPRFESTWVCAGERTPANAVVAVGLYGSRLAIGTGSRGGWNEFGPIRRITRSEGPVLYELNGEEALTIYKRYLGDMAAELPGSALLFPLRVTSPDGRVSLVRTVLEVDEQSQSMRFAGNVPEGWSAQLMRATVDSLVQGANEAAEDAMAVLASRATHDGGSNTAVPVVAIGVSCIGRRLVMDTRTDEELEACLEAFGDQVAFTGFYSYGEISPVEGFVELHNQSMTLTLLSEADPDGNG